MLQRGGGGGGGGGRERGPGRGYVDSVRRDELFCVPGIFLCKLPLLNNTDTELFEKSRQRHDAGGLE